MKKKKVLFSYKYAVKSKHLPFSCYAELNSFNFALKFFVINN